MLELRHIDLQFSDHFIFTDANFTLYQGQKYGVVGRNGTGKTTLFSLILKSQSPDRGDVIYNDNLMLASVEQEIADTTLMALDYVIEAYPIIGELWLKAKVYEQEENYEALADAHMVLAEHRAYDIEAMASKILIGLGFSQADLKKSVSDFSGGWQVRLKLARCLIQPADVLLLDEPTNHLDMDAIIWLEAWLKNFSGSLLLISHDKYFLDAVTTQTLALENKQLVPYKGGYSQYEHEKHLKATLAEKQQKKQAKQREKIESFINRFRAKATKAKQVQSRIKHLEKMPEIISMQADSDYELDFFEPPVLSNPVFQLDHFSFSYGNEAVFEDAKFSLNVGDRVGLLGLNGAGKSTLIKLIAGELTASSGKQVKSQQLAVGYFAQHQLESLKLDETALQHMQKIAPQKTPAELRSYLGRFNFSGNKALQKAGSFSGGEKARLALALIIWQRPNVLLLDEPTNHLDMDMREALTLALQSYEGVLVMVSHDRYLLEATVDHFYLVDHQKVTHFDGDLNDYAKWSREQRQLVQAGSAKMGAEKPAAVVKPQDSKQQAKLEREMVKLTEKLAKLDQTMSEIEASDFEQIAKLSKERKACQDELDALEEAWLQSV